MIKTYELPEGRKITAYFDENGICKITVQALDSLVSELNHYATPCDDAISRAEVLKGAEILRDDNKTGYKAVRTKYIRELPSVTQKSETGHWILDETDNSITCDKCGCLIWANDISNGDAHYCPNCGAKMESEDKNETDN